MAAAVTKPLLIVVVSLGIFAGVNIISSVLLSVAWRFGWIRFAQLAPAARAARLVWLRATPAVAALTFTLMIVAPAFVIFEPAHGSEEVGAALATLAVTGAMQLTIALVLAAVSLVRTAAMTRSWLRASTPLDVNPPAGVPAYAIDTPAPIVALVGVIAPKLIAARAVINVCTHHELAAIVAHERGHLRARDNLKRWLMASAPDALRWTRVHREIATAWHNAAEDAADDVATCGDEGARADLAALLLKISRLTPQPVWPRAATISPFVDRDDLPRRVRRLLAAESGPRPSRVRPPLAMAAIAAVVTVIATSPAWLERVFAVVETLVALGR
jgi:Zn-dependent protease with chaperone function